MARPYFNRILTPLFLFVILWEVRGILPGSTFFANVSIGFGTISITLGSLFTALVVLYLFFIAAWILQKLMESSLPGRLQTEPGLAESMATLIRYTIIGMGMLVALSLMGFDLTSLAIVAGGLSVGIGIGLQDVVANFISGLILLFEQSLRPGDVIQVEGRIVVVESIGLRATIVKTRTNEEVIIPNATFTTQQVTNLTKTDNVVRVLVPLGVSYKSDPEAVRQISIETVLLHPDVLDDPPPLLLFKGFGDSSLDFALSVSINQPELTGLVRSDLYYMLVKAFAAHDIEIPFPQRDLNLGDGWEKLVEDYQSN